MSCTGCPESSQSSFINPITPCISYPQPCGNTVDASCVIYSGTALSCSDVDPNSTLQVALQAMDAAICAGITIDWSSFDYFCLPDLCSCTITTAQQFIETISEQFCTLRTAYNTFSGTTYVAGIADLQGQIDDITGPGLTSCAAVNVGSGDTLIQVLTKILTNLCTVNDAINPSTANWSTCFSVGSNPTTVITGFNEVLNQICQVKALIPGATVLPTFNNVGTCLASPTSSDTLVSTIIKIRTLLCTLPIFTIDDLTFGCVDAASDLQETIQNLLTQVTSNTQLLITQVGANLSLTPVDGADACAGYQLNYTGTGSTDRFVALNTSDVSPGTLAQKITAGSNVTLDFGITNPGQLTINATGPDGKVSVQGETADYLLNKLNINADSLNILSWNNVYNSGTEQEDITPAFNLVTLATQLLDTIQDNPTLLATYCAMTCGCEPCTSTTSTTTTTISPNAYVYGTIENAAGVPIAVQVTFSQLSPTVAWFDSGSTTIATSGTISTGGYLVTASTPVDGVLVLKNNNAFSIDYDVSVLDDSVSPVPGSTTLSGTLTTGATLTTSPFTYGTSPDSYHLGIRFSQ